MKLRIGTRKSKLALIQTDMAISAIKEKFPEAEVEIIKINTTGDKIQDKNLYDIGGKALFLKELEEKLFTNEIDIAVHSLKDVPGVIDSRLELAAMLLRADARDCFVSYKYKSIEDLPQGAIIGSSSVRRQAILKKIRPDLKFVQFRGNVPTRLEKLKSGLVDATILAVCGLKRLGLYNEEYCNPLSANVMLPAAGQGAVSLQVVKGNHDMKNICKAINHDLTWKLCIAERGFLTALDASCRTPIAAYATFKEDKIHAKYMIADEMGNNATYILKQCVIEEYNNVGELASKDI